MNIWLWVVFPLSVVSLIYGVLACGYQIVQARPGMSAAFVGYLIANVGLIYDALTYKQ